MWDLILTGAYTVPSILKIVNEEWGFRNRQGRKIGLSSIYKIFTNPFYAGLFSWKGEIKEGKQEPIITMEEFDKAQIILGKKGKPRNMIHQHAYTGIIKCSECESMITAEPPKIKTNKGDGKVHTYNYMRCTKRKKVESKCLQKCIRVEQLEEQIDEKLLDIEISEDIQKWVFKQIRQETEDDVKKFASERANMQKAYNENELMIETLTKKLLKGVIDDLTYKSSHSSFEMERARIKQAMTDYDKKKDNWIAKAENYFQFATEAHKAFNKATPEKRREILVYLSSNLFLKDKKLILEAKLPFDAIKDGVIRTKQIFGSFEPLKGLMDKPNKALEDKVSTIWSG